MDSTKFCLARTDSTQIAVDLPPTLDITVLEGEGFVGGGGEEEDLEELPAMEVGGEETVTTPVIQAAIMRMRSAPTADGSTSAGMETRWLLRRALHLL